MISEAIILAGGFGTRLSGLTRDIPKPMAPVNNRPFLEYLLDYVEKQGINHVIMSTGYLSEAIESHFGNAYNNINISYSVEKSPLGTGGAVKAALRLTSTEDCLVLNGDTLFTAQIEDLENIHRESDADISLVLREVDDVGRYGAVIIDDHNRIKEFTEKGFGHGKGLINGGIYLVKTNLLTGTGMPDVFSLEKDLFSRYTDSLKLYGIISDSFFIDIGTPDDYRRAFDELKG